MNKILIDVYSADNVELKCDIEHLLLCELSKLDIGDLDSEVIKAIAVLKRSELVRGVKNSSYFDSSKSKPVLDEEKLNSIGENKGKLLNDAILETRGIIAVCGENAVELFYTKSCCGGTANSEDILGLKVNYLRKVICKKCHLAGFNKVLKVNDYADRISKKNSSWKNEISNVLRDVERDETGRIISINFLGKIMNGQEFMEFFQMPTNRVYFIEDSIEMRALGEGLGLGICLEGANNLADEGFKYDEIIKYYYTGVELKRLDEDLIANTLSDKSIVIDPGHGGEDLGEMRDNIVEKEVNLIISRYIYNMLENIGCKVFLTRHEDKSIPLSERVDFINSKRPDFYISIHQNSFMLPGVNGVEAYCYEKDREAFELGKIICEEISCLAGVKNRGIRYGDYYLLRECKVSGLIIECMYITGNKDIEKFSEHYYRLIGEAIFKGICRYYELSN